MLHMRKEKDQKMVEVVRRCRANDSIARMDHDGHVVACFFYFCLMREFLSAYQRLINTFIIFPNKYVYRNYIKTCPFICFCNNSLVLVLFFSYWFFEMYYIYQKL
jgi:hypothetical protein